MFPICPTLNSRSGQESCNHTKNVSITLCGVVKSGCVDQCHGSTIQRERLCHLDYVGARLKTSSDTKVRSACKVDELSTHQTQIPSICVARRPTVVFPLPVAPITLNLQKEVSSISNEKRQSEMTYAMATSESSIILL